MATQFYSALNYLNTRHDFVPVNDQPPVTDAQGYSPCLEHQLTNSDTRCSWSIRRFVFHLIYLIPAAKKELARDLILKTKEIDLLIGSLPGIGVSEEQQIQRLEKLENELQEIEKRRREAVKRKEELQKRLDEVIQIVAINSRGRP